MLSVEDIHLYYGASHALRGVSLAAGKGRVTCVLGRNGVGMTSPLVGAKSEVDEGVVKRYLTV